MLTTLVYLYVGLSRSTLSKILAERETYKSPSKCYKVLREKIVVDSFDRDAIRREIYAIYEQKEHVTLPKLMEKLKNKELFHGKKTKLATLLKEMGFSYRKMDDRRYYYEYI